MGNELRLSDVMAWEDGEMDGQEEVVFFQHLVNTGMAWKLQGCYGRRAKQLIDAGLVEVPSVEE